MRIAVTSDFSGESQQAFGVAAALVKRFSAELYLFHHAQVSMFPKPLEVDTLYDSLEEKLASLLAGDSVLAGLEGTPVLVRGGNVRRFAEALKENDIDLLVLATHGRTGVKRFLLGSFVESAVRFAPCPALVCRTSEEKSGDDFLPRRVLLAHDLTSQGQQAADFAHSWVKAFGAQARFLHVIDSECGVTGFEIELYSGWHEYHERQKQIALKHLQGLVSTDWKDINADVEVSIGHPVLEILSMAEEFRADLLVMGTHGGSPLEQFLLGRVAEKVLRQAQCPVLMVRGVWDVESAS